MRVESEKIRAKVDGKTAIVLMVEWEEFGYHKDYSDSYLDYLKEERVRFYIYLRRRGRSKEEAEIIIERIREDTRRELRVEWMESFYFSPSRESKEISMEIDIMGAMHQDKLQEYDQECQDDIDWEQHQELIAMLAENKSDWDRWKQCFRYLEALDIILKKIEEKHKQALASSQKPNLSPDDRHTILQAQQDLYELRFGVQVNKGRKIRKIHSRFGDGIYISAKMWKENQNRINTLMGSSKRYPIIQKDKTEPMDMMEVAVYGLDLDNIRS
jgi:hypothetical protein